MMDDRVAVVTGGARGVGEAIARRFARDGIGKFALIDLDGAALELTAQSLRQTGAEVLAIAADLSAAAACETAVAQTEAKYGRIDVLANCAGSTARGGILDTTEAGFDRLFAVNVKAPFFMTQNAARVMLKRKSGVIINIASMLAYGGPPHIAIYSITKAAVVALTKNAANSLKRDGIRVYAINLGWAVTPQEHQLQTKLHGLPEDWAERIGAKQPFGRLIIPDDVGGLCAFLVSRDAAMMTGNIIDLEQFVMGTMDEHPAML